MTEVGRRHVLSLSDSELTLIDAALTHYTLAKWDDELVRMEAVALFQRLIDLQH